MKKLYLLIFMFLFAFFPAYTLDGLRFESITNKNGLSNNTVRRIMQDSRGFMWISTSNGLNRYDGGEFVVMYPQFGVLSLTESKIRNTVEDANGHIWVHSNSRIVDCYDSRLESFVDYTGEKKPKRYIHIKPMSNGDMWMWGDNGAYKISYMNGHPVSTLYDKNNIRTNIVHFVYEDSTKQIWAGTDAGLLKMNEGDLSFCPAGKNNIDFLNVAESKQYICFFTGNNQIVVFDKVRKTYLYDTAIPSKPKLKIKQMAALDERYFLITGETAAFVFDVERAKAVYAGEIFGNIDWKGVNIIIDNKGGCWMYNGSGQIRHYRKDTREFDKIELIPPSILSVIDLERYNIYCDSRNIAWITTYGNGLFAIELNTGKINHFTKSNSGLKTNYLLSVSEDRLGKIWIGTEHTGILKITLTNYNNRIFFPDNAPDDIENKIIRTIYEDRAGYLWIGTKRGNVYVFDKDFNLKHTHDLSQGMAYCIAEDSIGNKWIGTKGNGLYIFSCETGRLTGKYTHNPSDSKSIGSNNIYSIWKDSNGRMWIGAYGSGLFLCEKEDGKLNFINITSINKEHKGIRNIIQDRSGQIWVGGNEGIVVFRPDELLKNENNFKNYRFDKDNPQSLNNNEVKYLLEDSAGRIWVGTSGGGLNLAEKDASTGEVHFKHYPSTKGLINNIIQAILEDSEQNLWISTESGISKFNIASEKFENYGFSDVWESDLFCESSCCKRKNGELLFGSYNGMYIFNPGSSENTPSVLPVILTKFEINGTTVSPNTPNSPLKTSITDTKSIRLESAQNSFRIKFSNLNYEDASSNRYIYILENYDKVWNPITQYNVASYKNIPPGKYVFKVKSSNGFGNWQEKETALAITVVPPFWRTWQAFLLYTVLLAAFCFVAGKFILKMNRLNNNVKVEKQLTEYRLRFFTNISHEFRTPLTIIRGSIENIDSIKSLPPMLKKQIKVLDKSALRLMRLIDQLLEFRKIQNDRLDLKLQHTEAIGFFREIYEMFTETAGRKNIRFTFHSNEDSKRMLLDREKMDKIAFNLLSNAFKHTPAKGNIKMEILFDEKNLTLNVADSGIGIPPDKQSLLFKRFQQINYSDSGIGIGLHLTCELANAHKGEIAYRKSEWEGACFSVAIPVSDEAYRNEEIIESEPPILLGENGDDDEIREKFEYPSDKSFASYKVLLVEDDEEIRMFLEDQLGKSFTVITAQDGLEGFNTAVKEQPDLIVCDVMMPEMDGFEVTKKLKTEFESSHIPIILLTAHASMKHQIEGIEAGADAYIVKPFSMKFLTTRIIKMIEQREKLRHKFTQEPGIIRTTICTTDHDNEFIKKINRIIEENLGNPDFSSDTFAQYVNLGRTTFYKKIKGITGYSPKEYIRILRLKKAAELLSSSEMHISEIAYSVGFIDPLYFSRCFKKQFGVMPSLFKHRQTSETSTVLERIV
ncbi:MAG: response regulator [Dysgonamonadaceae bacterium]|jgi:signal transduction histidine kinase/ligand-binding sensor domain-containing protein/AraC-like DNA-binding protein|nr:response regulator [Dysgonamonadaceae bacterium]